MNVPNEGYIKGRGYVVSDAPFVNVIGGANIDVHGKSLKRLRSNDSNPGAVHSSAGGVARNIAENLARLGVEARLITAIGNDHHGQMLKRLSQDAGIDMQYVHEIASVPTSIYLSVIDDTGDMQVAIADMSIIDHLGADRLRSQQAMLKQSSLNIIDTNLSDEALAWLTGTLTDVPLFADTVSTAKAPRLKPYLSSIHTLKAGASEVEALTGMQARTMVQLQKVADSLHATGVERVFVTRGEQGVFYSTAEARGQQKPWRKKRDVDNAGGAGDAFIAGLAYAWLEGWSLDRTLGFALAAAEITLSHPATSNPELSLMAVERVVEAQRA